MRLRRSWLGVAVLSGFLILTIVWMLPSAVSATLPTDPDVVAAFDELNAFIGRIPDNVLNKGQRQSFLAKLNNARKKYMDGDICTAQNVMGAFLNEAQAFRKGGRAAVAEDLHTRGRGLVDSFFDIFFDDPTLARPRCFDATLRQEPQVSIQASDNMQFMATVAFGAPRFSTAQGGSETWTQVSLPAVQSQIGPSGLPALPSWQALVAIPHGSTPMLTRGGIATIREILKLNLYPYQPQPVDQTGDEDEPLPGPLTFADKPFSKNAEAYETNAFYPANPCAVRILGSMRDLQLAQVQCVAGQYNPVTDELRLFDSVEFDVQFEGGDGNFITSQSLSPFEKASEEAMKAPLNSAALSQYVRIKDLSVLPCLGEELLILTHPNFAAAAAELAQWKRDKGIATTVINVGAFTSYATAAQIDDLIQDRYDTCLTRVSYVLLLGDSEFVPPSRTDYNTITEPDATTGSDWGYATYPHLALLFLDALFPYFSVGRIPVDTAAEAQAVVDKIIQYESDPPFLGFAGGGPFYTTASVVSQFQCCRMNQNGSPLGGQAGRDQRSFVETSETVRNALMADGYTVERIYTETVDNGGNCLVEPGEGNPCPANQIQQPYNGNIMPNRYYDGDLLPMDLRSGSGFAWNGSTQDIIDAFNDGRFLITHRDHGGSTSWGHPPFSTGNLGSLANGELLPFVYSINCKSGYWDMETDGLGTTESLMERLLMQVGGGMVGGIGDVRNSPTWPNSAILRGFVDATWPGLAPEFGSATPKRRLGDILSHGKFYLATQVGVAQPAGGVSLQDYIEEIIMYHAIGDPTLEMWTGNPHGFILTRDFSFMTLQDRLVVNYSVEGATITALQETNRGLVPVGRAMVQGGVAVLSFFHPPDDGVPIMLSASLENAVSVLLTANANRLPDLVIRQLDLGASNIVIRGEDLAGRLKIKVANIGNADAPGTINPDGSIKTGYMIDLVLSTDMSMPSGFAAVPHPAGVAFAEDGLLQGGRVSRTQDVPAGSDVLMPVGPPISNDVAGVIPLQAPTGKMFLCGRIDPGEVVVESNEANNVTCVEVTVIIGPTDAAP